MITEEQRRALFALREALRLCECAGVMIQARENRLGSDDQQQEISFGQYFKYTHDSFLNAEDIEAVLQEHPE